VAFQWERSCGGPGWRPDLPTSLSGSGSPNVHGPHMFYCRAVV